MASVRQKDRRLKTVACFRFRPCKIYCTQDIVYARIYDRLLEMFPPLPLPQMTNGQAISHRLL